MGTSSVIPCSTSGRPKENTLQNTDKLPVHHKRKLNLVFSINDGRSGVLGIFLCYILVFLITYILVCLHTL